MSNTLEDVKLKIAEFSDRKFGSNRPYTAPLHHLKLELEEVIEDGDILEYADCMLLLMDSFRMKYPNEHSNFLLDACIKKIEICEYRKWGEPDENGVFQHIKEDAKVTKKNEFGQKLTDYQLKVLEYLRNFYPDLSIEIGRGERLMVNGEVIKGFLVSNSRLPFEIDIEVMVKEIDIQILKIIKL